MKAIVYQTGTVVDTPNYRACMAILEHCNFVVKTEINVKQVMMMSCGMANPGNGFAIGVMQSTDVDSFAMISIRDYFKLIDWINKQGFCPLTV